MTALRSGKIKNENIPQFVIRNHLRLVTGLNQIHFELTSKLWRINRWSLVIKKSIKKINCFPGFFLYIIKSISICNRQNAVASNTYKNTLFQQNV